MLLGTLGASLLANILARKGIVRELVQEIKRKRNCKIFYWKTMGSLMLPHPLANLEIQKY